LQVGIGNVGTDRNFWPDVTRDRHPHNFWNGTPHLISDRDRWPISGQVQVLRDVDLHIKKCSHVHLVCSQGLNKNKAKISQTVLYYADIQKNRTIALKI